MRKLETLCRAHLPWALALALASLAEGAGGEAWRYYRVGNTGLQGDYNEAIWIDANGNPYIGGYDPSFEEGGFSQFLLAENRWVNVSNVDYQVIGHPNDTGCARVRDIVPDETGRLWMGTGRGALVYDPAVGPSSLIAYGTQNSSLPGGWTTDVDRAPDGTLWFVAYSTVWGGGGLNRYNPATNTWTYWALGGTYLAAQPRPGGGYYVWTADSYSGIAWRFDSATGNWTQLPHLGAPGEVAGMPGKDCVDDVGNFWALRLAQPGDYETLDYRRQDGTWVSPPAPYPSVTFDTWAFKAFGDRQALLVDGNSTTWRFNGTSWQNLGQWKTGAYSEAVDIDAAGNVWVSGVGGAARRDAATGQWQRFRITNTGNFDDFNRDLTITASGDIFVGANAGAGIGGMARFDGTRWTGWNNATYGLGYPWPFPNDNCHALAYRPSSGRVAVSPLEWAYGIHEWTGSGFDVLLPSGGAERMCEDSAGRLWSIGEYFSLSYLDGAGWHQVPILAWGSGIRPDPTRPATIWAWTGYEVVRTDGSYRFSRTIADFPELTDNSDQFTTVAPDADGIAWIGCSVHRGVGGMGGALIRLDTNDGSYEMIRYDQGWPFPGNFVSPWAKTPDGRLWMQYDTEYPFTVRGLCWWDGVDVGSYPAPISGEPQWGGLPHAQIEDVEVKLLPGAYELWMTCVSRGIAVLHVPTQDPAEVDPFPAAGAGGLGPVAPNPSSGVVKILYSLPADGAVRLAIYDVTGRRVRTLLDGRSPAGTHEVAWDGRDERLRSVPSGVYYARMARGSEVVERRITRIR